MASTTLRTLLGDYPNTLALKRGEIASDLVGFAFDPVKVANRGFKRVVREGAFDVAELALVTFLQAKAYGKPLVLMPAVVGAGRYQHHCLVHNVERGRLRVAELAGKRIGIRAYAQTTVAWVRGILADDYGVDLDGIRWVTFEDGHLAEFPDPPGVTRAEGRNMVEMLLAGELDAAIIGTDLPDDPRLAPVLPDPHAAAAAWGKARHGADQPHGGGGPGAVRDASGGGPRGLPAAAREQGRGPAGRRRAGSHAVWRGAQSPRAGTDHPLCL